MALAGCKNNNITKSSKIFFTIVPLSKDSVVWSEPMGKTTDQYGWKGKIVAIRDTNNILYISDTIGFLKCLIFVDSLRNHEPRPILILDDDTTKIYPYDTIRGVRSVHSDTKFAKL